MVTLSSSTTSSTLSRLSNSNTANNNNNNTSTSHNGTETATPVPASFDAGQESSHTELKATTRARGPPTGQGGQEDSKQTYTVGRDTKSLDYIARTMLAGGIAGITVRQTPLPLLSLELFPPPSLPPRRLICLKTDG